MPAKQPLSKIRLTTPHGIVAISIIIREVRP
ncbi:hypothetical protein PLANPX_1298 [Lacipirellula parvula]|uniref:Uncharacterized protein n=1 Tax=Lacipirellula parvula TaxID=2650471 RepID=A0A5K7XBF5_9BACT|nr:hypothetical protein PLANPX_1298 [Lacipirellula parvula]